MSITGKDLINWGFKPGAWFNDAIKAANEMREIGFPDDQIRSAVKGSEPAEPVRLSLLDKPLPYAKFIEPENEVEAENVAGVMTAMDQIMRLPTVVSGAIMPDACPTGPLDIPVGGVVATKNAIHPGFHSSDVCCSMAITVFDGTLDPAAVMDAANNAVHFGPQARADLPASVPADVMSDISNNPFLSDFRQVAESHFTTQGDGNHFFNVGHLESTGQLAVVSHHGSRGLGAKLYKRGMIAAEKTRRKLSPDTPKSMAWIEANTDEGRDYWEALQVVRRWTKSNHYSVHDLIAESVGGNISDRFFNEHNFVFRKPDGLFYHAKGATPSYDGFSPDDDGRALIPMNMAEPVLIVSHGRNADALDFAPHGAGRNMSRTRFKRENTPAKPDGIDVRFYCGIEDPSELPEAYKSAEQVTRQIEKFGLAKIIDRVMPYGSIMAGDWERDAPWRKKTPAA